MSNFQLPVTTTSSGGGGFAFNLQSAGQNATAKPAGFTFGNLSTAPTSKPITFNTGLTTPAQSPVFGASIPSLAPGGATITQLNTTANMLLPKVSAPISSTTTPMFGLGTSLNKTVALPTTPAATTSSVGSVGTISFTTGIGAGRGKGTAPAQLPSLNSGFNFGGMTQNANTTANALNQTITVGGGAACTNIGASNPSVTTAPSNVEFNFSAPTLSTASAKSVQQIVTPLSTGLGSGTSMTGIGGGGGAVTLQETDRSGSSVISSVNVTNNINATIGLSVPTTGSTVGNVASSGFASLSTATKTTDSSSINTALQVSYNQLEEHINKWTLELEEQEKIFTDQATQINAWDKILISNNQKILELNDAVQKIKADQSTLEQELEFIATQHRELEESITPLQQELMTIPQADVERLQTYSMVENLDNQLKQMSEDLKEIIDNLNESSKSQDINDPIIQIGKILNAHMSSLQWIETSSTEINNKLEEITKTHDTIKKDSERSFRSIYYT